MRRTMRLVVVLGLLVVLSACTAGPNTQVDTANAAGVIAGFWLGLWHGMIAPVTFILSLFMDNLHMYEVHNNGGWYNAGFLFGVNMAFGGNTARRSWRKGR